MPTARTPEAVVFDPQVLAGMFGDEGAVISAVLATFVDGMAASMAEVHQAMGARDLGEVAGVAHRIKGAARMSGALALGLAALALEHAARAGEWSAARAGVAKLELQWRLVRDQLAARP